MSVADDTASPSPRRPRVDCRASVWSAASSMLASEMALGEAGGRRNVTPSETA
eukprot:CAMPEP_0184231366 /NCGR_PEP_ID=MMETSP0976-20121227/23246_1 /TAXON_ID=483370 /ORGANISM="non described non described, Strain CCMP2097" /LENGTH=52 /DNA_ID=CAMNT_0026536375 /DNA_START=15 /DNA_END=170 /DNA_ORIENTATION=-